MKAVILDADKVVMNSIEQQALSWREALRHFCQFVPLEFIRRKLSEQGAEALKSYFLDKPLKQYRRAFINHVALVFNEKYQHRIQVRPYMSDLLEQMLSNGLQVGLISTASQESLMGNKQLLYLESFMKIRIRFAVNETVQALTDVLDDSMALQGISDPTEVIVVCATPALARAARGMNMSVVGFTGSGFVEEELRTAGCHEVYATPAELTRLIENSSWWSHSSSNSSPGKWRERIATLQHMKPLTMKF